MREDVFILFGVYKGAMDTEVFSQETMMLSSVLSYIHTSALASVWLAKDSYKWFVNMTCAWHQVCDVFGISLNLSIVVTPQKFYSMAYKLTLPLSIPQIKLHVCWKSK